MKNIFYLIIWFFYSNIVFASNSAYSAKDTTIVEGILTWIKPDNAAIVSDVWKDGISEIFVYTKSTIFDILALIVIGTFLFIGYKILMARWKPEEFKKAFMMLIYAILGLLFISLSWVIVIFISGLKI